MLSRFIEASGASLNWLAIAAAGVAVVSYCLGCFNGAVVVSRYILRNDVRNHGSGNAGLTNFYRVFGGPLTLVVILSDVVKAVIAVMFAVFIAGHISPELIPLAKYWAGTFCLLGHMYPCTFQFRGGKGILSGGTIVIMMGIDGSNPYSWCIPVIAWLGFIILAGATRYVSLGSCWAGFSFPFTSWLVYRDPLLFLLATIVGGLILWKHRGNIVRLVKGTESKFILHKKAPADAALEKPEDIQKELAAGTAEDTEPASTAEETTAEDMDPASTAEEITAEDADSVPEAKEATPENAEPVPAEEKTTVEDTEPVSEAEEGKA